jgi:hypothetical protein
MGAGDARRPHSLEDRIEEAGARLLSARVENGGLRSARRRRTNKVRADLDAAFRGAEFEFAEADGSWGEAARDGRGRGAEFESAEADGSWGEAGRDGRSRGGAAVDDHPAFAGGTRFAGLRETGASDRTDGWPGAAEPEWRRHREPEPQGPSPMFSEAGDYVSGEEGRRTITIRGRGGSDLAAAGGRRAARRPHERAGFKPDRIAMWAVMLGVVLILVAATSSHAAALQIQHLLRPR